MSEKKFFSANSPVKLKEISLKEREELEPMLVNNPDLIEDGMKILGHQIQTDTGPLDILALDSNGALTVIELKDEINDDQLNQGLRYYDWVRSNTAWLSIAYKDVDPKQTPRLMLIAPGFSESLKRLAKYTTLNTDGVLELKEYHAVELPSGEKTILCANVEIGEAPQPTEVPTLEEKIGFIQSDKVRQLLTTCIEQLREMKIEVRPIGGNDITCWYKNKRFIWIGTRRQFFVCAIQGLDGKWTDTYRISNKDEWDKVFNGHISPTYKVIDER